MKRIILIASLSACSSAPSTPTWQADVQPIIAANCVRCHGASPAFGAPKSFRLDILEDSTNDPETGLPIHGARTMYYRIMERVDDGSMPPKLPVVGDAVDVLDNWAVLATSSDVINGFAKAPDPGGERSGNHAPTFTLAQLGGGNVYYTIDDADRDLVDGQLLIGGNVVGGGMRSGQGVAHFDLSNVPGAAGMTPVDLVLNDGVAHVSASVFQVDVSANPITPVNIGFDFPKPLDVIGKTGPASAKPISFCANQPGLTGDVFIIDAQGAKTKLNNLALAIADCPNGTTVDAEFQAFKNTITAPLSTWRIEVDVADARKTVVSSGPFRISRADNAPAASTVAQIFKDTCGECHHTCGAYPATLPYDFNVATGGAKCGQYYGFADANLPGMIYERVIVREDMPGPWWKVQLTSDQRKAISDWILGGANP